MVTQIRLNIQIPKFIQFDIALWKNAQKGTTFPGFSTKCLEDFRQSRIKNIKILNVWILCIKS